MADQASLSPTEASALNWALGELGLSVAAQPPRFARDFSAFQQGRLKLLGERSGPFTMGGGVCRDGARISAELRDPRGRPHRLVIEVEDGSITLAACPPAPLDGFPVRPAAEADYDIMAEIERRSPIQLASGELFQVHRPRLRDFFRLQERAFCALIEHEGMAVAARSFAWRRLQFRGGESVAIATSQIARVLPEFRGHSLMRGFAFWSVTEVAPVDCLLAYVDPGNETSDGAFPVVNRWRRRALELTFDCAAISGPPAGRPATSADAAHLADLANTAHGDCALYGLQGASSIAQRLERAPDAFTWGDVLVSERAMLGVWPNLDETTDHTPGQTPRRRTLSVVLDYGFNLGAAALDELTLLLAAQAARMQAEGASHLVFYTYPGSPAADRLAPMAETADEIMIQANPMSEPQDLPGLYTDPLYL